MVAIIHVNIVLPGSQYSIRHFDYGCLLVHRSDGPCGDVIASTAAVSNFGRDTSKGNISLLFQRHKCPSSWRFGRCHCHRTMERTQTNCSQSSFVSWDPTEKVNVVLLYYWTKEFIWYFLCSNGCTLFLYKKLFWPSTETFLRLSQQTVLSCNALRMRIN